MMKKYKPTTPSQRSLILVDKSELSKEKPIKSLTTRIVLNAGRNNSGKITVRGRKSFIKRKYRLIDNRRLDQNDLVVSRLEYDPNRSAFVALVKNSDEKLNYILAPHKIKVGDKIKQSDTQEVLLGMCLSLSKIPVGTLIHNLELKKNSGFKYFKSAGVYGQIVSKEDNFVSIKCPSGKIIKVNHECRAVIGTVSNPDHANTNLAKAGRRRLMGFRPKVRGVAMNPVDHPHGGGEGKTSGGRHPVSYSGVLAKGFKTVRRKS